jgi:hypothetical protein
MLYVLMKNIHLKITMGLCHEEIMKNALAALLLLLGCGLPEAEDDAPVQKDEAAVTGNRPQHEWIGHPGLSRVARAQTLQPETLGVTLTGLPDEGRVFAVVGMLSCGFLEAGRADAALANGKVTLNVPLSPQTTGAQWSVFFFIDADGDGQCTNEHVLSAQLPLLPATGVQLDVSTLTPAYAAGCWAFQ